MGELSLGAQHHKGQALSVSKNCSGSIKHSQREPCGPAEVFPLQRRAQVSQGREEEKERDLSLRAASGLLPPQLQR